MGQNSQFPGSIPELSNLLRVTPAKLLFLARNCHLYYRRDEIRKPDGRIRVLCKPCGDLKKIQRTLHRKILKELPVHDSIHSYRKRRDQKTNALPHVRKPYIIKLDIKDFFPSITRDMVRITFLKLGFSESIIPIMVQLTTYSNQLPQGAPTSPLIADLVLFPLARRVECLCIKNGITFTVYGDDITVSGNQRILNFKNLFLRIIRDEGYTIHLDKLNVLGPREKKKVTGVVVNVKANIDKEYYRELRCIIHNCCVKGPNAQFASDLNRARNSLIGKINHVRKLNPKRGERLMEKFNLIDWKTQE